MNFFDISMVSTPAIPIMSAAFVINTLTITGPDSQIEEFLKRGKGELYGTRSIMFDNFVKTPPNRRSQKAVYEWRVKNWGTKDNPEKAVFNQRFEWLEISFETAWSAPVPLVQKLSAMYNQLRFDLRCDFTFSRCYFVFEKGEVLREVVIDENDILVGAEDA